MVAGGTLVIGYDGSEDAREAVRRAGALRTGRRALLVTVWESLAGMLLHTDVESLEGPMRDAARELDEADRDRARQRAGEGAELAREAGLDAEPFPVQGRPKAWPALLEVAETEDAAAVVVGSRGLSGVRSALVGSVSAGVLGHAERPVLVVPVREEGEHEGPVVIGYDGSEPARHAVEEAGRLLSGRPALVVSAWTSAYDVAPTAALGAPAGIGGDAADQLDEEIERGARARSEEGAEVARAAGLDPEARAERTEGNVWTTLLRVAGDIDAAAVAVGSRGRSALASALLGSVSRGVVTHATGPVLVVPRKR